MVTPILAMQDPYDAAKRFRKLGWNIDFMTPHDATIRSVSYRYFQTRSCLEHRQKSM